MSAPWKFKFCPCTPACEISCLSACQPSDEYPWGAGPCYLAVELGNIVEGSCGSCESLATEYITAMGYFLDPGGIARCTWIYTFDPPTCGAVKIHSFITQGWPLFTVWHLYVIVLDSLNQWIVWFRKDLAVQPDCLSWNELVIPRVGGDDALWTCDGSAATCKVTSVH